MYLIKIPALEKLLLILDLDETLIHAAKQPLPHACDDRLSHHPVGSIYGRGPVQYALERPTHRSERK